MAFLEGLIARDIREPESTKRRIKQTKQIVGAEKKKTEFIEGSVKVIQVDYAKTVLTTILCPLSLT